MAHVDFSKVPTFYHGYILQVAADNLKDGFAAHTGDAVAQLQTIPASKWSYRYAEGKWSIKEVVQHIIDAERVFTYRALRFARQDRTPLPGFDEKLFAQSAKAEGRQPQDLLEELSVVQRSSALLFQSFDSDQLAQEGEANGKSISVEAIGYIILGHTRHHLKIIKERYLS